MLIPMNRRWALLPFLLLASACRPDVPDLPPDEVLRRAMLTAQATTSAAFSGHGTMAMSAGAFGDVEGKLLTEGLLTDSGNMVAATTDLTLAFSDDAGNAQSAAARLETIFVRGERMYLKVQSLQSPTMGYLFDPAMVSALQGAWWYVDAPEEASASSVTPSVRLLQAQANVVAVTRDLGVTTLDDTPAYHYAVAIDPERFLAYLRELHRESDEPLDEEKVRSDLSGLQATGEFWIRASDAAVLQMQWDIPALALPDGSLMHLQCTLRWKDAAGMAPIVIPTDAKPFSAAALLPAEGPAEQSVLPEGVPEDDLRNALDDYSDTAIFPPEE